MGNGLPENWYPTGSGGYSPEGYTKNFYLFNDDNETVLESYSLRYTFDEEFEWKNVPYDQIDNYISGYTNYVTSGAYYTTYPNGMVLGRDIDGHRQSSNTRHISTNVVEGQWEFKTWINNGPPGPAGGTYQFYNTVSPYYYSNTCKGDMAVYYLGRCGCWNDFLFEGTCKRIDDITHYDYGTDGYNRMSGNPEYSATVVRYCNETTTKFECTTGWLTDKHSEYFAQDFMPSIKLMIHDLKKNKIYPAVIEDTSVETKKFLNNKEMNKYTVTFRVARDNYIR